MRNKLKELYNQAGSGAGDFFTGAQGLLIAAYTSFATGALILSIWMTHTYRSCSEIVDVDTTPIYQILPDAIKECDLNGDGRLDERELEILIKNYNFVSKRNNQPK